jgi:FkbM family methyltransferase
MSKSINQNATGFWFYTYVRKIIYTIVNLPIEGNNRKIIHLMVGLLKKILPVHRVAIFVKTVHNYYILTRPEDNSIEKAIYNFGFYEPATIEFLNKVIERNSVFIDVGANIGLMTIPVALKKHGVKVLAFEPITSNLGVLKQNMARNKISNVELFEFALGAKKEILLINLNTDNTGVNSSQASLVYGNAQKTQSIEVDTLDNVITKSQLTNVSVIKCDVEGYELNVFKGASNTIQLFKPILIFEYVYEIYKSKPNEIFDLLLKNGDYSFYKFKRGKLKSKLVSLDLRQGYPKQTNIIAFNSIHQQKFKHLIIT